jgi:hypothetical protein
MSILEKSFFPIHFTNGADRIPINQLHDSWKTRIMELLLTCDENNQGRSHASLIDVGTDSFLSWQGIFGPLGYFDIILQAAISIHF